MLLMVVLGATGIWLQIWRQFVGSSSFGIWWFWFYW